MTDHADLIKERGKVYGDPKASHEAIAMIWAPILHAHRHAIERMEPLPPHAVAQMFVGMKLSRARLAYHDDNYRDLAVYAEFADRWQGESEDSIKT